VYQLLGDWFAGVAIALLVFAMMQMVRLRGHAHVRDSEFVGRLLTTASRPDVLPSFPVGA
jgi:hypothetical protein